MVYRKPLPLLPERKRKNVPAWVLFRIIPDSGLLRCPVFTGRNVADAAKCLRLAARARRAKISAGLRWLPILVDNAAVSEWLSLAVKIASA